MKKAIMFIALVAASVVGANAQKFQGGEKNLEVTFSPLSASPIGINGIRFRLFNSESSAIRVGFNLNGSKKTDVSSQAFELGTVTIPALYSTHSTFGFSLRPGYEKHFAGTDRLSPYVGAELLFAMESMTHTEEYHSGNSEATAADAANWSTWTIERNDGTITFGLNAVAGFDYYFADNFYLGVELGLGFQRVTQSDAEITVSDENAYLASINYADDFLFDIPTEFTDLLDINDGKMETVTVIGDNTGKYKDFNWGPNFQSTFRLGWLF